eukprot:SAG31_NODE_530_length_14420_cov_4.259968_8_plen_100_part_00
MHPETEWLGGDMQIYANMAYHAALPEVCAALQVAVPALVAAVQELPAAAAGPTQPYMRAFRALCAVVDADHEVLVSQSRAYPWLLVCDVCVCVCLCPRC